MVHFPKRLQGGAIFAPLFFSVHALNLMQNFEVSKSLWFVMDILGCIDMYMFVGF